MYTPFLIIACFIPSQALMFEFEHFLDCWKVWYLRYAKHPFHVSVSHFLKFYYLENSTSILVNALVGNSLYMISQ